MPLECGVIRAGCRRGESESIGDCPLSELGEWGVGIKRREMVTLKFITHRCPSAEGFMGNGGARGPLLMFARECGLWEARQKKHFCE